MTVDDIILGLVLALSAGTLTALIIIAAPALRGAFHHLRTRREA